MELLESPLSGHPQHAIIRPIQLGSAPRRNRPDFFRRYPAFFRLDHRSREPSERIELSIREVERLCVKRGRREHGLLEERHEGDENSG
jgi:hypothetical protein